MIRVKGESYIKLLGRLQGGRSSVAFPARGISEEAPLTILMSSPVLLVVIMQGKHEASFGS